jgi:hypothetical protein
MVEHRLLAAFKVDNGKPPVTETNVLLDESTTFIRAAMPQDIPHLGER